MINNHPPPLAGVSPCRTWWRRSRWTPLLALSSWRTTEQGGSGGWVHEWARIGRAALSSASARVQACLGPALPRYKCAVVPRWRVFLWLSGFPQHCPAGVPYFHDALASLLILRRLARFCRLLFGLLRLLRGVVLASIVSRARLLVAQFVLWGLNLADVVLPPSRSTPSFFRVQVVHVRAGAVSGVDLPDCAQRGRSARFFFRQGERDSRYTRRLRWCAVAGAGI